MGSGIMTPPQEPDSPVDGILRKRVCKACDRCRLKKSKCDGNVPCSRCKVDNAICVFGERKKSHDKVYPKGYVEMLENQQAQLVTGLQELYRRLRAGEEWSGEPLKASSNGTPLTHDILEYLGALKQEGHPCIAPFEENLELLQRKLIANGSGFLQREQTFDSMSDADSSPTTEQVPLNKYPMFSNPFANSVFPPTPPSASPHLRLSKTGSPLKEHFSAVPQYYDQSSWPQMPNVNESFDFSNVTYDTSMMDVHYENTFDGSSFSATAMAINPCMTMKNWPLQDEYLQQYFQTSSFS